MKPAESVFMQRKRRIAGNAIESPLVSSWSKLRRLIGRKIGDVDPGPFALPLVPPNQFLALAPRLTSRFGARSIIYDAPIGRPGEAPAVPKIIRRVPRKRLVDFVRTENAGVNPGTTCGRTVGLQSRKTVNLRTVVRVAFAIETEHDSVCIGLKIGVPAVDLSQYGFHFWITHLVFRVPPVERAQRFVYGVGRLLYFGDHTQGELMHEPPFRSRITWRVHRFLAPLQKTLRVGERAFLFRVTGSRKEEDFRIDIFGLQFAALNLRRVAPKCGGLDLDHLANDQPF